MSHGGGGTENAQETAKFLSHYHVTAIPGRAGKKAREKRLSFLFLCF
jgi:hypothetical protein